MHRLIQANRGGLTLIEMMVALVAACIVLLAMSTIMVFGQKSLNRTMQQANLQRDASCAMLQMESSIRNAAGVNIDTGSQGMTIDPNANWIRFWFVPAQKNLKYQLKTRPEQTLLKGVVDVVTFNMDPNTQKAVVLDIQLHNGDCEARMVSTTMMRNIP
jgi:prepilin-type N-terminal cleavage/methylation domain-containing protein